VARPTTDDGYRVVSLEGRLHYFARVVCATWHGQPPTPEHTHVMRIDGDRSNNRPENLKWATPGEIVQRGHDNPNRKSSARGMSKPVRGRKQGTEDEWTQFESGKAAARELGPGFRSGEILAVANGKNTHTGGWTFELTQQYEMIEGEQWRAVVLDGDVSGAEVSDCGRFRDTRGIVKNAPGSPADRGNKREWRVMAGNGKAYSFARLVCAAWHGPPPTPTHQVHRKNFDSENNRPDNLEWVTRAENVQRSLANGDRIRRMPLEHIPSESLSHLPGEVWKDAVLPPGS
jgi:hypothetical protein